MSDSALSAWSLDRPVADDPVNWPAPITREWAWQGSDGDGIRVCVLDSGVDGEHPAVGGLADRVLICADEAADEPGIPVISADDEPDVSGHGTACASVIRSQAPGCVISSGRVLGPGGTGRGADLIAGVRWAVRQRFDVVNVSLSTTRPKFVAALYQLADEAYFAGTLLVASAHNMPVISYPWHFASVVSVGSHDRPDPLEFHYNANPPVEFFARGEDVEVAWPGGGHVKASGNSLATPHITGLCALIRAKHPQLTPFEVKTVLRATATNQPGVS
ncbi:MAG TPA: S8 family serine peptidase [Solirubrobacteraceae bacterium]|nr:S8 family serine peptidase [Solirubrobacteraceae bacterium]